MLVTCKDNELRIEGVNDLGFVLKRIPLEITARKKRMPPSTDVLVIVEVDGVFRKKAAFDRNSKDGKADIAGVEKKLRVKGGKFALNDVYVKQTFSVRMTLSSECQLGKCTGKEIVHTIKERLEELKANGFVVKEPPFKDQEVA